MNPDGSGLQCVTQSTANDDGPSWSPDGALIAFRSDRDGNTEIYRMPATIGATLRLTNSSGADADPSWGPRPLDPAVRLWGADRYLTAVAVSGNTFGPGAASAVVLARGDLFPDALAGTPLAYQRNAPILLTPTAQLAAVTRGELLRVLPVGSTVFLLGGTAALSTNVEQQVQSLGYTTVRLGGATRYGTAALIAQRLGSPAPLYLATGQSFQAALVSGVAAAHTGGAVVLTEGNRIPGESQDYLDTRGGVPRIAVGPEAIQADPTAAPVGGSNQYEVARNLANQVFGPSPQHAALASGTVFADGLTGGPHIARRGGPLLLTDPVSLSSPTGEYLLNHAPPVDTLWVYGGSAAISHGAVMDARRAISGVS